MSIVKKNTYSKGNSDFDIQLENYSTIECLGKFELNEENKLKTINLKDLDKFSGLISKF